MDTCIHDVINQHACMNAHRIIQRISITVLPGNYRPLLGKVRGGESIPRPSTHVFCLKKALF